MNMSPSLLEQREAEAECQLDHHGIIKGQIRVDRKDRIGKGATVFKGKLTDHDDNVVIAVLVAGFFTSFVLDFVFCSGICVGSLLFLLLYYLNLDKYEKLNQYEKYD